VVTEAAAQTRVRTGLLIGGEWTYGAAQIEVRNPANPDEVVGTIVRGTADDVNAAVAAAKAAQLKWAACGFRDRAEAIGRGLDRLEEGIEERAVLFVRENGKTLAEARGELSGVPKRQRLTLEFVPELEQDRFLEAPAGRTVVTHRPYGVVVSIVPWNSPVSLGFSQIVSALLAGNTVVVKPPETAPLAFIATLRLFAQALPAGVINVVTGDRAEIGDVLTGHPDVAKIGFTGSIPAARHIICKAAETIKGMTLELGGNDAAIVLEDVDLSEASMARMAASVFKMTGQVCLAIKRIYVAEAVKERFLDAFSRAVDKIVVGDGLAPLVTMGPLHTRVGLERVQRLLEDAVSRGAVARELGTIADDEVFARGHFMRPTIVTGVPDDAPLMTEEQFGPAIPIVTFQTIDEAIARANDTIFGLGGSIWTSNIEYGLELVRKLDAGTVWLNSHGTDWVNRRTPYGGIKQSGIGRKAGLEGVLDYMEMQTITTFEGAPVSS
jgi:acyl-CoA reductase-like NAD-dependent aldehyde dehydrogenase